MFIPPSALSNSNASVSVAVLFSVCGLPSDVPPSMKVTVPEAVLGTEAVSVTVWLVPETISLVEEVSVGVTIGKAS